jgi:hypothetical protein
MLGTAEREQPYEAPLSPELVLVSPELRELALRELTAAPASNGSTSPPSRPPQEEPIAGDTLETTGSWLRGLARGVLHAAAFAAVSLALIAGAASVLTLAGGQNGPELADRAHEPERIRREWRSPDRAAPPRPKSPLQGIGAAAVHDRRTVGPKKPLRAAAGSRLGPLGLTSYGRLVWNLDALVRDRFGDRAVCLSFALNLLSPAACAAPAHGRSEYRSTFAARKSAFRVRTLNRAPRLRGRAIPLKAGTGYISCGSERWLAAGANWGLVCEAERRQRRP